jgi:hypothetical protein
MREQLETPVAFILFRRPEKTARVFDRIRAARPTKLFLIAEGARAEDAAEARACEATRTVVENVDWPCEVTREYASENLGLKYRIPTGLDRVFAEVDRAIILEDDCLPHPSFFPYCEQLLERYADDERIVHIAGSQLLRSPPTGASYHFTRYPHIWGWATWRRAWRHYDVELSRWHGMPEAMREAYLQGLFEEESERRYWRYVWNNARQIDNWDAQWHYICVAGERLAINPNRNLIGNIGFGADATFGIQDPFGVADLPLEGVEFPLSHPAAIEPDMTADAEASRRFFRREESPPSSQGAPFWRREWERLRWATLRAGGRALDLVPEPVRPKIRHRDRR